ncbi:hypothetical protein J7T55_010053 [Diaporthe amygdali]|uniref:uncharacterized protein n=1 Tax=Phomopsis amygdali TaxID=1214568 RepID=UPI0022FF3D7D|nr:uncharacterized protein J7T55_010053 [Diaporthe amygdali]KAJ0113809.1 hypothetical protein J7T55_010053 [Diaporthe amygdali]
MSVSCGTTEIISRKKALYGRFIDTKQWDKLSSIALPDAELRFFEPDGSLTHVGRTPLAFTSSEECASFFHKLLRNAQTLHMFGRGELDQINPDEIRAIWPMEDQIILRQGWLSVEVRGGGYYYETWRQKENDWFLESLVLRRTYTKPSFLAWLGALLSSCFRPKEDTVFDTMKMTHHQD